MTSCGPVCWSDHHHDTYSYCVSLWLVVDLSVEVTTIMILTLTVLVCDLCVEVTPIHTPCIAHRQSRFACLISPSQWLVPPRDADCLPRRQPAAAESCYRHSSWTCGPTHFVLSTWTLRWCGIPAAWHRKVFLHHNSWCCCRHLPWTQT